MSTASASPCCSTVRTGLWHLPITLLQRRQDLSTGRCELRTTTHAGGLLKKRGLPEGAAVFPLTRQSTLLLFELLLDASGLGELLAMNGLGDVGPEAKGFMGELLVGRRERFGRDREGPEVNERNLDILTSSAESIGTRVRCVPPWTPWSTRSCPSNYRRYDTEYPCRRPL